MRSRPIMPGSFFYPCLFPQRAGLTNTRCGARNGFNIFDRRFFGGEHIFEFLAGEKLHGVGINKNLRVFIGRTGPDEDGKISANFLTIFLGGFGMGQVDNGFFPAPGFENQGAAGLDGTQPETHLGLKWMGCLDQQLLFLQVLCEGLVQLFDGDAAGPLEGIHWDGTSSLKTSDFDTRQSHGGGEAATLGVANDETAGAPVKDGRTVKRDPTTDAKQDKLPGFDSTEERCRNIRFHFDTTLSRCQAKFAFHQ